MRKCIIYSLCFGVLASILLVTFAPYCSSVLLHNKVTNMPIYVMAISLPFNSLVTSLDGYFTGVRRVHKSSFSRIITMLLQVILTLYFLYILPYSDLSIVCTYLMLSTTIATVFQFALTYVLYLFDRKKMFRSL